MRLTAQTIAVDEGRSVSTVKIDGRLDEIFELQDRLVEELVRQGLQRELQQSERRAIGEDVRSPEAYEAYSRGMLNLRTATQESTERAIALFERALELDPGYLEALIALGSALQLRGSFLTLPHVLERSKALLEKAVALAPKNAEAHVRLGQTLISLGATDAAEAEIRKGLDLEPDSAVAHGQLARLLWLGRARIDDAITHFLKAAELAPQAGYTYLQLALLYALNGDLDAAERHAREAVDLQQRAMSGTQGLIVVGAHTRLGYVHYLRGQYQDAVREYRRELNFLTLTDHALRDRSIIEVNQKLSAAYLRLGAEDEARTFGNSAIEAFDRRLAAGADDPFTRYYLATLHALRDDVEPVLAHLERPLRELGAFTRWRLPRDPDFVAVLAHPAVAALLSVRLAHPAELLERLAAGEEDQRADEQADGSHERQAHNRPADGGAGVCAIGQREETGRSERQIVQAEREERDLQPERQAHGGRRLAPGGSRTAADAVNRQPPRRHCQRDTDAVEHQRRSAQGANGQFGGDRREMANGHRSDHHREELGQRGLDPRAERLAAVTDPAGATRRPAPRRRSRPAATCLRRRPGPRGARACGLLRQDETRRPGVHTSRCRARLPPCRVRCAGNVSWRRRCSPARPSRPRLSRP